MKILLVVFIVLAGSGVLAYAMGRPPRYHPGGPYYYRSWASYVKPYRPTEEISEVEAQEFGKKGISYYVAYFDDKGKIRSFTKYLHGQVVWEERYKSPTDDSMKLTYQTTIENFKKVHVGMSPADVSALLGEPGEKNEHGWVYYFDHLPDFPGFKPNEMTTSGCHIWFDAAGRVESTRLDKLEAIGIRPVPPPSNPKTDE